MAFVEYADGRDHIVEYLSSFDSKHLQAALLVRLQCKRLENPFGGYWNAGHCHCTLWSYLLILLHLLQICLKLLCLRRGA